MIRKLLLLLAWFSPALAEELQAVDGRIKITVHTTSGCSDALRFINQQLVPTYALYKEYLDIEFVPWGRASRNSEGHLSCQFGARDCWANRHHRCALHALAGRPDAQAQFMACEFTVPLPSFSQMSYACSQAAGLNLTAIDYCVANPGDELDLADEVRGAEMLASINFIPSIVFNDRHDVGLHRQALVGLQAMVCKALSADPASSVLDCAV